MVSERDTRISGGHKKNNAGPNILIGSKERRTGKIFVDMTGGTGGSKDAFERLSQAGVRYNSCYAH